jgi:hypothetical protein
LSSWAFQCGVWPDAPGIRRGRTPELALDGVTCGAGVVRAGLIRFTDVKVLPSC